MEIEADPQSHTFALRDFPGGPVEQNSVLTGINGSRVRLTQSLGELKGFPGGSGGKESACSAGDPSSIPGLGRFPGEGNGNPLQ